MNRQLEISDTVAINFFKNQLKGEPTGNVYYARCPVCGDSNSNKYKKRMYLLKKNNSWLVFCHNCNYASSLLKFAKDFFPSNYDRLVSDSLTNFFFKKEDKDEALSELITSLSSKVEKRLNKKNNPVKKFIDKHCVKLTETCKNSYHNEIMKNELRVLKNRLLSDEFIDSLYFCIDGKDGKYKYRVIIPFYDSEGEPYYFQAKGTQEYHKTNKYINWDEEDKKPIYNESNVDVSNVVYVTEGLLDSLFVKNGVASTGTSLSRARIAEIKKKFKNRVWVMDNDYSGIKVVNRLLEMGEKCFLMPQKYEKVKDLNDLAILLKKSDLTEIIKENTYNTLEGLVELSRRQNGIHRKGKKREQV